jgi:hypothetical protein
MPAANAASPGVNGDATQNNASNGAPAQAAENQSLPASPETAESSSSPTGLRGLAAKLNLPADITDRLEADAAARHGDAAELKAESGKQEEVVGESAETADATTTEQEEHEETEEHESTGNVFNDPRVQKRLAKAARQRDRLVDIALDGLGATADEIDAVKSSQDPIAEAAALKAELMERGAANQRQQTQNVQGPQAPTNKGLLGNVTNEQQLEAWESHATDQMEWCDRNPDGVTVGEGASQRFVEPSEIAKYRKDMEKVLLQAPKRRQEIRDALWQQTRALDKFNTIAREEAPELWDPQAPGYSDPGAVLKEDDVIVGFLRDHPAVANDPRINVLLTRYARGWQARGTKAAKPLNPDLPPSLVKPHPPLAPVTAGPPSRSAAPNGSKRMNEAMQAVYAGGGTDAIRQALRVERELEKSSSRSRLAAV